MAFSKLHKKTRHSGSNLLLLHWFFCLVNIVEEASFQAASTEWQQCLSPCSNTASNSSVYLSCMTRPAKYHKKIGKEENRPDLTIYLIQQETYRYSLQASFLSYVCCPLHCPSLSIHILAVRVTAYNTTSNFPLKKNKKINLFCILQI